MPAFGSVVDVLIRELGDFLYSPQGRPAGGRLRRPSSAGRLTINALRHAAVFAPSNPQPLIHVAQRRRQVSVAIESSQQLIPREVADEPAGDGRRSMTGRISASTVATSPIRTATSW